MFLSDKFEEPHLMERYKSLMRHFRFGHPSPIELIRIWPQFLLKQRTSRLHEFGTAFCDRRTKLATTIIPHRDGEERYCEYHWQARMERPSKEVVKVKVGR